MSARLESLGAREGIPSTDLPLVELLWRRRPQADQAVVLDDGAGALARWREALHLRHVIQALLDVAEVASFGRGLVVGVGVSSIVPLFLVAGRAAQAALQAAALLSQLHFTLQNNRTTGKSKEKNWWGVNFCDFHQLWFNMWLQILRPHPPLVLFSECLCDTALGYTFTPQPY